MEIRHMNMTTNATDCYWLACTVLFVICLRGATSFMIADPVSNGGGGVKQRCERSRYFKMLAYDCSNMNLRDVPQHLQSDVELLLLTMNRIRELAPSSFVFYEDIRMLYLTDNMIHTIEANTFSRMQSLEVIDLSTNGLTTLPRELFDLPVLRNLHASHNNLFHLTYDLTLISKPIRAPLQWISLSKCRLANVPDFGPMPDLLKLNISDNHLADLTPDSLAPLCALTSIDLNNTQTPRCPCFDVQQYLTQRNIRPDAGDPHCERRRSAAADTSAGAAAPPDDGLDALAYCAERTATSTAAEAELNAAPGSCSALLQERVQAQQTKRAWIWVMVALVAFLALFVAVLYAMHVRNVRVLRMSKAPPASASARNRRRSMVAAAAEGGGTDGPQQAIAGATGRLPLDVVAGNAAEALLQQQTTKV